MVRERECVFIAEAVLVPHIARVEVVSKLVRAGNVVAAGTGDLTPGLTDVALVGAQRAAGVVADKGDDGAALGIEAPKGRDHPALAEEGLKAGGRAVAVAALHVDATTAPGRAVALDKGGGLGGLGRGALAHGCDVGRDIADTLVDLLARGVVVSHVDAVAGVLGHLEGVDGPAGESNDDGDAELHDAGAFEAD